MTKKKKDKKKKYKKTFSHSSYSNARCWIERGTSEIGRRKRAEGVIERAFEFVIERAFEFESRASLTPG